MVIVGYENDKSITVKFDSGEIVKTYYKSFINGNVKSLYDKSIYGVGYIGVGKYKPRSKQYYCWASMLGRCYDKNYLNKYPTYQDCTVCEEWNNFQNFGEWYDQNYYEINNEKMCLDKDILIKGNKIYSPNTSVFVPEKINTLFEKGNSSQNYKGVTKLIQKKSIKYNARCFNNGGKTYIGTFNNIYDAFEAYKYFKENLFKEIADYYKLYIPINVYKAMYEFNIEITD